MTTVSSQSQFSPEQHGTPVPHVLRLRTGDLLVAGVIGTPKSGLHDYTTMLYDPVQVYTIAPNSPAEAIAFRPWLDLSDGEKFPIAPEMILTFGPCKREIAEQYARFIARIKQHRAEFEEQYNRDQAILDLLLTISPNPQILFQEDDEEEEVFIDDDTDTPEEPLH